MKAIHAPKCWSLLTIETRLQYGGNEGYQDEPHGSYRYDTSVANCREVAEGDVVLIRGRTEVLGVARIERIVQSSIEKIRRRCPVCSITLIKERTTRKPRWRCDKGHEFDEPAQETARVTQFEAFYKNSFTPLKAPLSSRDVKAAVLRPNDRLSIEEIDPSKMEGLLAINSEAALILVDEVAGGRTIEAEDADEETAYQPRLTDRRDSILKAIRIRRGQRKFRGALMRRYGPACLVSGCVIADVLEAAHIWPHRGEEDNHVGNGLLLRADIHTLFDLNLLGISPESMEIHLHTGVKHGDYLALHGRALACSHAKRPSREALELRWQQFLRRLSQPLLLRRATTRTSQR
jgi:putative restriction endonuclease